jgi:hypothetical protein
MKKISLFTICATLFVLTATLNSCKKEDLVVVQDLSDWEVCLPATSNYGTTVFTDTLKKSEVEAAFTAVGATYSADRIKNLKLKQISAQITTNAVTTDFDEIGGFEVYAKGPGTTGDGTQIAYTNGISADASQLTMLLNGAEIKDLLSGDYIVLTLRVSTKQGGHNDICFKLTGGLLEYKVSAE